MKRSNIMLCSGLLVAGAGLMPAMAFAANPGRATGSASAHSVVLSQADVAKVYGAYLKPFLSYAYGAKEKRGEGCIGTYKTGYLTTFFSHTRPSARGGVISVESSVFAYAGSIPQCAVNANKVAPRKAPHTTFHLSSLSGLGDSAYLMSSITIQGARHIYSVAVRFNRGSYLGLVMVSSMGSAPSPSGYLRLAHTMDQRMQAGG